MVYDFAELSEQIPIVKYLSICSGVLKENFEEGPLFIVVIWCYIILMGKTHTSQHGSITILTT